MAPLVPQIYGGGGEVGGVTDTTQGQYLMSNEGVDPIALKEAIH